MYVIAEGKHAIVIDPFVYTEAGTNLIVDYIILTHEHYDHISGVNVWKTFTNAPVLCSRMCAENIQNPKKNLAKHFKEFCALQTWLKQDIIPEFPSDYKCFADKWFEGELVFQWQGHIVSLFEIPGHSQGSIGILLDDKDFFRGIVS